MVYKPRGIVNERRRERSTEELSECILWRLQVVYMAALCTASLNRPSSLKREIQSLAAGSTAAFNTN